MLRWEFARLGVYQGTSGGDVVNHIMMYWCAPGYGRDEDREFLKESGERFNSSRGVGHTEAGGGLLSQHAVDL